MRHDNGSHLALGAAALLTAAAALSGRQGARNEDDEWEEEQHPYQAVEQALRAAGLGNIGLNADWSVMAWEIGRYQGHPAYLIDNEDDTYSVVLRFGDYRTINELAAMFPGWRTGQPIPAEAYQDAEGNPLPPQYRSLSDGYNDIIPTIWESKTILTPDQGRAMVANVLSRFK
jgi:hypothetical protein